jgi:hypothetical protein
MRSAGGDAKKSDHSAVRSGIQGRRELMRPKKVAGAEVGKILISWPTAKAQKSCALPTGAAI